MRSSRRSTLISQKNFNEPDLDEGAHGELHSVLLEGKDLTCMRSIPIKSRRRLVGLLDLHSGDWIFDSHAKGVDGEHEPVLQSLLPTQPRPLCIATWLVG